MKEKLKLSLKTGAISSLFELRIKHEVNIYFKAMKSG